MVGCRVIKKNIWKGKFGPLLIAEIGGNHEGNFSYAKKLTKEAIKSGADVIKFQLYSGNSLYFSKDSCHCNSFNGGKIPIIGFHSTIDKPDCVNLVIPPTRIIKIIKKQEISNQ